jgi:hypothetical protein
VEFAPYHYIDGKRAVTREIIHSPRLVAQQQDQCRHAEQSNGDGLEIHGECVNVSPDDWYFGEVSPMPASSTATAERSTPLNGDPLPEASSEHARSKP